MDYQQTIDYLFNQLPMFQVLGPGAYKPGLQTAWTLAHAFGDPQEAFKTIHVGGTNGKGSTSHMLASVLIEAGYRVGLYTSPHIFDFRERIRVNGEKISESAVVDFVERYKQMHLDCSPSFFELTTIMAFDYFRSEHVDIAVIEVGLGGRLDTTNIIQPILSVITNVSLDHTSLLGDTEPQIAAEKAGIIKAGVPVVIGESAGDVREVFRQKAQEVGAPIVFADDDLGRPGIDCDLHGEFQDKNINTVLHALDVVRLADDEAIGRGLSHVVDNTHLIGRWMECRQHDRDVIFDTGHNIGAWRYIAPRLCEIARERGLRVVVGFSNDKDIDAVFGTLPAAAKYYFVTSSVKRGRDASELLALAERYALDARAYANVPEGYMAAISESDADDVIFVGGSNFVVADIPLQH